MNVAVVVRVSVFVRGRVGREIRRMEVVGHAGFILRGLIAVGAAGEERINTELAEESRGNGEEEPTRKQRG